MKNIDSFNHSNDYIVEPFTIDDKNAKTLDDGFSITQDQDGNFSFNIHISLVGLEYISRGYELEDLKNEIFSIKVKDYIGKKVISDYSLNVGLKKVLTLKIINYSNKCISYYALCEEIPVLHNYCYDEKFDKNFYYAMRKVLNNFKMENNHELVTAMMGLYSSSASRYLNNNNIKYIVNALLCNSRFCRRGSFTSPLRDYDSLLNQFIFLNSNFKDNYDKELFLFKEDIARSNVNNGSSKKLLH